MPPFPFVDALMMRIPEAAATVCSASPGVLLRKRLSGPPVAPPPWVFQKAGNLVRLLGERLLRLKPASRALYGTQPNTRESAQMPKLRRHLVRGRLAC
jgi:hypothetical protein